MPRTTRVAGRRWPDEGAHVGARLEGGAPLAGGHRLGPLGVLDGQGVGEAELLADIRFDLLGDARVGGELGERIAGGERDDGEQDDRDGDQRRHRRHQPPDDVLAHARSFPLICSATQPQCRILRESPTFCQEVERDKSPNSARALCASHQNGEIFYSDSRRAVCYTVDYVTISEGITRPKGAARCPPPITCRCARKSSRPHRR